VSDITALRIAVNITQHTTATPATLSSMGLVADRNHAALSSGTVTAKTAPIKAANRLNDAM